MGIAESIPAIAPTIRAFLKNSYWRSKTVASSLSTRLGAGHAPLLLAFHRKAFAELRELTDLGALLRGFDVLMAVATFVASAIELGGIDGIPALLARYEDQAEFDDWVIRGAGSSRDLIADHRDALAAPQPEGLSEEKYGERLRCPQCKWQPDLRKHWGCDRCGRFFDVFVTASRCRSCRTRKEMVPCPRCDAEHALESWREQV